GLNSSFGLKIPNVLSAIVELTILIIPLLSFSIPTTLLEMVVLKIFITPPLLSIPSLLELSDIAESIILNVLPTGLEMPSPKEPAVLFEIVVFMIVDLVGLKP